MSQLNLSNQLVQQICTVIETHDAAADDPGVASQYLSAIIGFLLGQQDMPMEKKEEILRELAAFTSHVTNDVDQQRRQMPPSPPPQEAFGIWKPK